MARILLLLCLAFAGFSASGVAQSKTELLWSNEQGCGFVLSTETCPIETFEAENASYSVVRLGPDFELESKAMEPELPYRSFLLALPVGSQAQVTVSEGESVEWTDVRLRPVGLPSFEDQMLTSVEYVEGESYRRDAWIPSTPAVATSPNLLQDWNTVYVNVYPVRYNPVQKRLRLYKKLTVTVVFSPGNQRVAYRQAGRTEKSTADNLFLNHPSAAQFKVRAASAMLRKTSNGMNTGDWYKIRITEEGVYKLDKTFFESLGISASTIDPSTIKIYNNGGGLLPVLPAGLDLSNPSDPVGVSGLALRENAIVVEGESDGKFDNNDYVLFYGRGNRYWKFDPSRNKHVYQLNYYSEENIYWLTFNDGVDGLRMETRASTGDNPAPQASFRDNFHFEKDETNFHESGLLWVFDLLTSGQNATYPASSDMPSGGLIKDPLTGTAADYTVRFKGANNKSSQHRFSVMVDNNGPYTTSVFSYAAAKFLSFSIPLSQISQGRLSVTYQPTSSGSQAALDWFEIQYDRMLIMRDGELAVFSPIPAGNYQYTINTRDADPGKVKVWDITTPWSTREIQRSTGAGNVTFSDTTNIGSPKRYYVFSTSRTKSVSKSKVERDRNSDLQSGANSADYVIITPRAFMDEADRLAQHRSAYNGFKTMVVDVQDIFDEFAGGIPDPTAIRDFLRYAYYRWQTPNKSDRLSHVLLMGDADYDYRNIVVRSNHNWVPTYYIHNDSPEAGYFLYNRQVDEAFTWINDVSVAFTIDEPYAFPYFQLASPDISIGRIPCNTVDEASNCITKTIFHETQSTQAAWRQTIAFVADDEIADQSIHELSLHTEPTESLAVDTTKIPSYLIQDKIYLIDYPYEWAGTRRRKILARDALIERINQGALIINYVGHGNPRQLAHEEVYLHARDFPLIVNRDKYFLFTNFSCSFAMFDQLNVQGGGEELVVAKERGCFGLLAATRAVFAVNNTNLMISIFKFLKVQGNIGEAIRLGKVERFSDQDNKQKYNYLGDPAADIHYATRNVRFDLTQPAVLTALSPVTLTGSVEGQPGIIDTDFNGTLLVSVFDRSLAKTYTSDVNQRITYALEPPVLYRGRVRVTDGTFSTTFVTPRDISYSYKQGSVIAYGADGEVYAGGSSRQIVIDSVSAVLADTTGPSIQIEFEGQSFASGDAVRRTPTMKIVLRDSSGINVTGAMGHQFQAIIDDRHVYDISEAFAYDVGSYRSGSAQVTLSGLAIGKHSARILAFDNANNPSSASFNFEVLNTEDSDFNQSRIQIDRLMNYPNPFRSSTNFTFVVSHSAAEVQITIYTVSGKRIRRLDSQANFGYNSIPWDGRDEDGSRLANGVYLYKVKVKSLDNASESHTIGKLMIAR